MHIDMGLVRGVLTLVWFLLFIALWAAAWSPRRRAEYDAAARLPFDSSDSLPGKEENSR